MGLSVILVECDVISPAGVSATLRFADRAIFPMAPADAERADVVWDDRLIEPPALRRTLFDDIATLEPGLGVGVMILANADRVLDPYQGHIWGEVRVWRWTYGTPFSTALSLLTGQAGGPPAYDVQGGRASRVRLTLYDARLQLERPLQSSVYDGQNNGEDVLYDGDAGIRGKMKPLAYGHLLNAHVPGVPVNHGVGAIQLHDGRIASAAYGSGLMQFFDRGGDAGLIYGGDLGLASDPAFFDQNVLDALYVYLHSPRGLLRFNANPVGAIAFGYRGAAPNGVYVETPGPIIALILARAGVEAGKIGASVRDVDCDCVIGAYADQPVTAREFIAWIATAGPMAVLPDRHGVWQATLLRPPAETAILTLTDGDILNLEADETSQPIGGEFSVGWDRIWTTYRRDNLQIELLGTSEEARLAEEYRYAKVEDAAFKARQPAWRKLEIDTPLRDLADAQALAETLKGLFGLRSDGRPRRSWRITLEMTDALLAVDLGATVALCAPAYGIDDTFILIGEEPLRPRRDQIIWTVWG